MSVIDYFFYSIAFMITLPLAATFIAYIIFNKVFSHKWKAIHHAVNWTTILYIIAVTMLLTIIFDQVFIGIIILLLLSILTGIIIFQWKAHTEVDLKKAVKLLWRISFVLFLTSYMVLVFIGILQRIFS